MDSGYKSFRSKRVTKRTHTRTRGSRRAGRKPGAKNIKTREREALLKKGATFCSDGRLAVEIMDQEIDQLAELVNVLYPWDAEGKQLKGKSLNAYYWARELKRDFLAMRAPYQSPRLSAVQIVPAQNRQQVTEVNVTILNEKGEVEYTDAPEDDELKQIEHVPSQDEEAA
jgi:hypothetical protein